MRSRPSCWRVCRSWVRTRMSPSMRGSPAKVCSAASRARSRLSRMSMNLSRSLSRALVEAPLDVAGDPLAEPLVLGLDLPVGGQDLGQAILGEASAALEVLGGVGLGRRLEATAPRRRLGVLPAVVVGLEARQGSSTGSSLKAEPPPGQSRADYSRRPDAGQPAGPRTSHHVRAGGPGQDQVAERGEEVPGVARSEEAAGGARPRAAAAGDRLSSTTPPAASLAPSIPSVARLATTAGSGNADERLGRGHRELLVASALTVAADRHRRLAAGQQAHRRPRPGARLHALAQDGDQHPGRLARLALEARRQDQRAQPLAPRLARGGLDAQAIAAHDARDDPAEEGSRPAWASRGHSPRAPASSRRARAPGHLPEHPPPAQDLERVGERRGVGHGGARSDGREVVAHDVGQHQADHARRRRGARQPAALEPREVLAHRVQLVDRRARAQEQRGRALPCPSSVMPSAGAGQQGGGSAREQHQQEVVAAQPARERLDLRPRPRDHARRAPGGRGDAGRTRASSPTAPC